MKSIVSYPDRDNRFGRNTYRGNCSGNLIWDIVTQYHLQGISDFAVGGGTTEDVARAMGLRGTFTDLNRGFDMVSMDIPERAENIFYHPAYWNIIQYSDGQYSSRDVERATGLSAETVAAHDLSRIPDWDEFIKMLNHTMFKLFAALEPGGRMFTLVGDIKRQGRLFSMLCEMAKPGQLEQVIIKAQHNCWSDGQTYSNQNFVPIVHEYLIVTKKEKGLVIPVSWGSTTKLDMRTVAAQSWRDLVYATVQENGGQMSLQELYDALKDSAKARKNAHWQDKIRQVVQDLKYFVRTERGCYALAPAA